MRNNPLTNTDPTGLDCVYLDNLGVGVDTDPDNSGNPNGGNGIDHHSSQGECNSTGGYWAPGYVANANSVHTSSNSDQIGIDSTVNGQSMSSIANCEECSTTNSDGSLMGAMTQTFGGGANSMSNTFSISQGTLAPSNNQKQLTTLFEAQETVEKLGSSLMIPGAFLAGAGAHYLGGTLAIGAGCLDPTPVEPATCAVGIGVGVETYSVGTGLLYGAYQSFKNVTIPTWKSIF